MKTTTFLLIGLGFFALASCKDQQDELAGPGLSKESSASVSTAPGLDPETHVPATRTRGTTTVNVQDYGATGGNTTDDTNAFQAAIDALPQNGANKGGTVWVPAGTYYIRTDLKDVGGNEVSGNCIRLRSNMRLLLSPYAHLRQISTSGAAGALILAYHVQDVEISGQISGSDTSEIVGDLETHGTTVGESNHGVKINYSQRVTIRDIKARDFWGDGFYVGGMDNSLPKCFDVDIDNVTGIRNRRQGLSITEADSVEVWDSEFRSTGRLHGTAPKAGIDVEPGSGTNKYRTASNILIQNCTIKDNDAWGIQIWKRTTNVIVKHCDLSANESAAIRVDEAGPNPTIDPGPKDPFIGWNELHNNVNNGLLIKAGSDGVTVTQNLFYANSGNPPISYIGLEGYYKEDANGNDITPLTPWDQTIGNWTLELLSKDPVIQTNFYK